MSSGTEKDQEEGEIVDDGYDEISDNSISFPLNQFGKSCSSKEQPSVICLSSLSELEVEDERKIGKILRKHRKLKHHGHHKRKKKYLGKIRKSKKWRSYVISSSDEEPMDSHLDRRQLKAAIRVESLSSTPMKTENNQGNCLKNRLLAMTKLNLEVVGEQQCDIIKSDVENKEDNPTESHRDSLELTDIELTQLRLEALKTAVLNKFEHRKKKKNEELQKTQEPPNVDILENNKENSSQENGNIKPPCQENPNIQPIVQSPEEEDEDVLRAILLASISQKMPKCAEPKITEEPLIEKKKFNDNVVKPVIQVKKPVQLRQHQIQPIIINVGSDTESEDEKSKAVATKNPGLSINGSQQQKEIESTVENFLKEQRAKIEEVQSKPKQVTRPTVAPTKPTRELTTPKSKAQLKLNESGILEKSAVKLLTKEKQLEYQKLMQRLKMAQRKPKTRRVSVKGAEEGSIVRKSVKTRIINPPKPPIVNKPFNVQQDAGNLHLILKQMQREHNGRLQIQEKYVVLTPLIKKINEATTQRKKYDQEVRRLLVELADAKRKLHNTNQTFSMYVKDLTKMKEEIDKRPKTPAKKNGLTKRALTSTPNRSHIPVASLDVSRVCNSFNTTTPIPDTSTIILPSHTSQPSSPAHTTILISETMLNNLDRSGGESNMEIEEQHQGEIIENSVEGRFDEETISCGDPNDLMFTMVVQEKVTSSGGVPEYVSPLDPIKRECPLDPFVIMCPYDICGKCRDTDCTYEHYDGKV